MTELNAERARQAIVEHTRRLAESAAAAGPDAAVPTTPEWTITDLVEHVGQTQHWVAEIIERRITDPAQLPTEMAVLPAGPREWQAWLSESAQRVASACSGDALDAPVFNPAGDERPGTRFWMSSVLNEAVLHGFDAANAADRPAEPGSVLPPDNHVHTQWSWDAPPEASMMRSCEQAIAAGVPEATIRKWASRGKLVRYGCPGRAEYDLDELFALADRLVVISDGRAVHETPIADADLGVIGRHLAGHA